MSAPTGTSLDLIPLSRAVLCLDCNLISASTGPCIACGSHALMHVERVLDAREQVSVAPIVKRGEVVSIVRACRTRRTTALARKWFVGT